jgi:hypothetical protein
MTAEVVPFVQKSATRATLSIWRISLKTVLSACIWSVVRHNFAG